MMCMQNDWQLDAKWSSSVVLWLAKVTGRAGAMVTVDLHFLKAELKKDPQTTLRTITGDTPAGHLRCLCHACVGVLTVPYSQAATLSCKPR